MSTTKDPLSAYFQSRMNHTQALAQMASSQATPAPAAKNPQQHHAERIIYALKDAIKREKDVMLEYGTHEKGMNFRLILDDGTNKSASSFSITYLNDRLSEITITNIQDGLNTQASGIYKNLRLAASQRELMNMISDDYQLCVHGNALNATGCQVVLAKGYQIAS